MPLDPNVAQAAIAALEDSARAYERRGEVEQLPLASDELIGQLTLLDEGALPDPRQ